MEYQTKDRYVSVSELMEKYSVSRATIIRWVRNNGDTVRYFKENSLLRVHFGDFENMIERKVEETIASDRDDENEG